MSGASEHVPRNVHGFFLYVIKKCVTDLQPQRRFYNSTVGFELFIFKLKEKLPALSLN